MKKPAVLVITKKKRVPKILNWNVSMANNIEIAIEQIQKMPYKVIAISLEMDEIDKTKLRKIASVLYSNLPILEYQSDTILADKVNTAYWQQNKPSFLRNYLNNSFEIKLVYNLN